MQWHILVSSYQSFRKCTKHILWQIAVAENIWEVSKTNSDSVFSSRTGRPHKWNTSLNTMLQCVPFRWSQMICESSITWIGNMHWHTLYLFRPLFTKRTDFLPQDLVKSRSCKIRVQTFPIALKFDSSTAEMPVQFQSNTIIITSDIAASRLHVIWR